MISHPDRCDGIGIEWRRFVKLTMKSKWTILSFFIMEYCRIYKKRFIPAHFKKIYIILMGFGSL